MKCTNCGHVQPPGPECLLCGFHFRKDSDEQKLRAAAEFARRVRTFRRAQNATAATGAILCGLSFFYASYVPVLVAIVIITTAVLLFEVWHFLRCPTCHARIGRSDYVKCPYCSAALYWARPRAADPAMIEKFARAKAFSGLCGHLIWISALGGCATVVGGSMMHLPWWIRENEFLAIVTLFIPFFVFLALQHRAYRCPRCRKALVESDGDGEVQLVNIEHCPFCGERLEPERHPRFGFRTTS